VRTPIVPLLAAAALAITGCAKKSYVQREVGEVNKKVDAVSAEVEKTQQRVQQNEVRIDSVDKSAQSGISEAKGSAAAAMSKAQDAQKTANEAKGKLIYTVTLSNDKVRFPVNKAEISDEAKALIDEAVDPLVKANRAVFFEIEGHTDSTGDAAYNFKLGEERAMAVRDYLAKKHQIALSRLNVISYGEEKPVTDNKTKEDRAQNRRVVIRILE
jgi:outer membrane protein OmpA-like peptidoglycan-associated protein